MLVLSRKVNENIIVNDNIVITVVNIRGDKVRLGNRCPKRRSGPQGRGVRRHKTRRRKKEKRGAGMKKGQ